MDMTRRALVRRLGAGAAGLAVGTTVTGSASATTNEWRSDAAQDGDVTIDFDRDFLERYQPYLKMSVATRRAYKGLFGYRVRSEDYDHDWACYWSQLTHQVGLPLVSQDAHLGDTEPIYVAVDPIEREPARIVYSEYHHYADRLTNAEMTLQKVHANIPTHPTFRVVEEWHNYQPADSDGGVFPNLQNWLDVRDRWIDNGFYDETSAAAIEDPAVMLTDRDTWWADDTLDRHFVKVWRTIGRGGTA